MPVEAAGGRLRLADVSNVVEDHQPLIGDAVVNDGNGLMLVVEKFPGEEYARGDPRRRGGARGPQARSGRDGAGHLACSGRRRSSSTRWTTSCSRSSSPACCGLVVAAFLFQWRTVLIGLFTIPLSLVAAAFVLDLLGETFNAISFAGLAAALAVVIDEAVAGAENVARRVRVTREAGSERPTARHRPSRPLRDAEPARVRNCSSRCWRSCRSPQWGSPGRVLRAARARLRAGGPDGDGGGAAVTPALSLLLFSRGSGGRRESPLVSAASGRATGRRCRSIVGRPRAVIIAAGVAGLAALAVRAASARRVIPSFKDRDVLVRLDGAAGNVEPADDADRDAGEPRTAVAARSRERRRRTSGARSAATSASRRQLRRGLGEHRPPVPTTTRPSRRSRTRLPDVQGVQSDVVAYSEQKIRDVGALETAEHRYGRGPRRADRRSDQPLVVRVFGQNLDVLRREAAKVRTLMTQRSTASWTRSSRQPTEQPNVEIEVDLDQGPRGRDQARRRAPRGGHARSGPPRRQRLRGPEGLPGDRAGARRRRAQTVADIENLLHRHSGRRARPSRARSPTCASRTGRSSITRDAVSRYLDVKADVSGRSVDAVAADIEDRLQSSTFPLEYHAEVLDDTTSGAGIDWVIALAAALAVFLLLQAAFWSFRLAVLAFLMLPVALAGGVLAAADRRRRALPRRAGRPAGAARARGAQRSPHDPPLPEPRALRGRGLRRRTRPRGAQERVGSTLTTAAVLMVVSLVFVVLRALGPASRS